jgi:hypothetical protein
MDEAIKITVKVNKLDKTAFFKGKNGDTYCSMIAWPNKDGEDQFGNVATIRQDLGVERKDEKTEIIGNGKPLRKRSSPIQPPQQKPPSTKTLYEEMNDADEIPF